MMLLFTDKLGYQQSLLYTLSFCSMHKKQHKKTPLNKNKQKTTTQNQTKIQQQQNKTKTKKIHTQTKHQHQNHTHTLPQNNPILSCAGSGAYQKDSPQISSTEQHTPLTVEYPVPTPTAEILKYLWDDNYKGQKQLPCVHSNNY